MTYKRIKNICGNASTAPHCKEKKRYQDGLENRNHYFSILNKISSKEEERKMCSVLLLFRKSTRKYSSTVYM